MSASNCNEPLPKSPLRGGEGVSAEDDRVAEALSGSESLYRTFLEQSPIGIAHLDARGVVTFENYQLRALGGDDGTALWVGQHLGDVQGLDERLAPLVGEMLSSGGAFAGDDFVVRRGGESRIAQIYGTAIQEEDGRLVGGVLMVFDVTMEYEREAELQLVRHYDESALALRDAALAADSPGAFLDAAVRILGETARAERVLALAAERPGDPVTQQAAWRPAWRATAAETPPLRLDAVTWQGLSDGDLDVADVHAFADSLRERDAIVLPFTLSGDAPGGFVLARDKAWTPTERSALAHFGALFETLWGWMAAEARYRQIVSTVEDSLFSFSFNADGERAYSFATRQLETLTGYAVDDLLTGVVSWQSDVVFDDDRSAVARHESVLREERESRLVYRIRTAEGRIRWLRESATPGRDRTGPVVAGILSDVTEAKEAEATLIQAKQDAESAMRMKSTFLSTMSHEIRTPLGAINGFADLLLEEIRDLDAPSPVLVEFAETIQTSSRKVLRLVNEIFDLASLQSGRIYVDRAPVALHPALHQAVQMHRAALEERGIDFVLDFVADDPLVLSEARRLAQVAEQLVSNAAKFTESGEVRVTTSLTDEAARFAVADTGIGIGADYLNDLFEPFSQEDNRLNRDYEGSGLGLAITKRLVEAMNGTIEVESVRGEGSTFTVTLPRADG